MEIGKKYIHYCWFGNKKLSSLAKRCIKSWKKYLPDYEIVCWNEENVDVNECPFIKEAYEQKKWAFVADYARTKALYEYGGIYFDTDMMVKKNIDFLLDKEAFVGIEDSGFVNVAVWGVKKPKNELVGKVLDFYKEQKHFESWDMYSITIPVIITKFLTEEGFNRYSEDVQNINGTYIYPRDYFYPLSYDRQDNDFTKNTCMVHYSDASWVSKEEKKNVKLIRRFGREGALEVLGFKDRLKVCAKLYGITAKKTAGVILWPLTSLRRSVHRKTKGELDRVVKDINIVESDYVVFAHGAWIGVHSSTDEFFDSVINLPEMTIVDNYDVVVNAVLDNKNIKKVFFAAFAPGWEYFARALKRRNPKLIIKVIWHGSNAMHYEPFDWDRFECIFKMLNDGTINSIVFVKKSMYEQYRTLGYKVEFLANTVHIEGKIPKKTRVTKETRIGIYASSDRLLKNFYNQMAAASLVKGEITIDLVPLPETAVKFSKILKVTVDGSKDRLSREELFKRIVEDDVVLYVSFVECAPMLPLECLELGVLCITGNNHHYWDNTPLEEYLIEPKADDPVAIAARVDKCLKNKEKIMKLYHAWKKEYDKESEKLLNKIMND